MKVEGVSPATQSPHSAHVVQFYDHEEVLIESLAAYMSAGLHSEDVCLVIATSSHREALEARLKSEGLDVDRFVTDGRYLALDAAETLAQFLVNEQPDRGAFMRVIGGLVSAAREDGRPLRAFGEMVALLCEQGNVRGAASLEDLWNELASVHPLSLFCAYPMSRFARAAQSEAFLALSLKHSHVVPGGGETERLCSGDQMHLAMALLEQKAQALEAEVAERHQVETRLMARERELTDFVEHCVVGLHQVGPDGIIQWANQAELDLLGYEPEEYIGHHIAAFHVDQHVIEDLLSRLLHGEALYDYPARLRCKDGSIKDVLIHSNGLFEHGRFVRTRCFTRDVTAQRRAEQEIQRLNEELQRKVEALERSQEALREKIADLERFHDVVVGRELKMMELEIELKRVKQGQALL